MKEYKIVIIDQDTGKVIDSYTDVRATDVNSSLFWPAIMGWLEQSLRNKLSR